MSNEINDFISELKKTRDYSGFAPKGFKGFKGHEGKTSKKVEKVASVEDTLTHHSDSKQQGVYEVPEDTSIISATISTTINAILKEESTNSPINVGKLSETTEPNKHQSNVKKGSIKTESNSLNRSNRSNSFDNGYQPFEMSDTFIHTVNEAYAQNSYSLVRNKRFDVDDQVHEILMQLKHQGHIKSVSTLINVILSDFIKNNKEALQTLFAASSNRINF